MAKQVARIQITDERFESADEIIDVRAPGEFAEDHISGAINLPVLDDAERERVGTIYKQESSFVARKIGAPLVSSNIGRHLAEHFADKPKEYRPVVYCWRGGQRSGSLGIVLSNIGWEVSVIQGGYKTYRRHVSETLEEIAPDLKLVVLNGYTGAGKTLLLKQLQEDGAQVLDLEGLACHKGSVFGGDPENPQPAQKRFESLIYDKVRTFDPNEPVFIEAESAKVGRLNLPNPLWQKMKVSPVVEIDSPLAARAAYLKSDYEEWLEDLERIHLTLDRLTSFHSKKQLQRWRELAEQGNWLDFVAELLSEHYDKCYTVEGTGHFEKPTTSVPLPSHSEDEISRAAKELLSRGKGLQ